MTRPILSFDLDGTLVDRHGRIHPNDIALLESAQPPAVLVPATGRSLGALRRTFNHNGLFMGRQIACPLVLQNGSLLLSADETPLAYFPFEPDLQERLIDRAFQKPDITFLFLSANQVHLLWPNPFGVQAADQYEFSVTPFTARSRGAAFSKIMCLSNCAAALAEIAAWAGGLPVEGAYSMPTIFEITPQGTDKGSGLRRLLAALGLNGRTIVAAGDGENDLPLLRRAAVACAPTTAPEAIRRRARHVIDVSREGLLAPMLAFANQLSKPP